MKQGFHDAAAATKRDSAPRAGTSAQAFDRITQRT
jgi:hypothetical protein